MYAQTDNLVYIDGPFSVDAPFTERAFMRTFVESVDEEELKWHRDYNDRIVTTIYPTDWLVQLDNELPKSLNEGVFIPKGVWHRVIKGTGSLTIHITETT